MMSTYSPCPECRTVNRATLADKSTRKPICGKCKAELPLESAINVLNASSLKLLIEKSPIPVVGYFWAPWCKPCKAFGPVFAKASESLSGHAVFAKVDLDSNPLAQDTFGIRGVPTLIVFRDGFERARETGAMPLDPLSNWILSHMKANAA